MNTDKVKLFLVDDDAFFLKALEIEFLLHGDFEIQTFPTGEMCVESLSLDPDMIILDYHLDGIDRTALNGMDTLDKIKEFKSDIPVVILSSQDKIDVAVDCMHHHALDYVVKSETAFTRLQKIITNFMNFQKVEKQLNWYMDRM